MLPAFCLRSALLQRWRILGISGVRAAHSHEGQVSHPDGSELLYFDHRSFPLPDLPFQKKLSSQQATLKEKERGPWKDLTQEDKISLYRIKFNKTYAEMNQPTNEWKTVIGSVLIFIGLTGLIVWWQRVYGEYVLTQPDHLSHFPSKYLLSSIQFTHPSHIP
ncbi:hypothetical protein GDO86_014655 [Hymenochirus boettgeri]|uniref:Cytochrome c oxidase subunit 4 n=1 Tax=Hymenochirus boettgeri TaxID=247094 RepID=A0A8T2JV28_9PIPI|nr:hypothetical protein GDO86_014655 [Hymenochirus boettgeri]